MKKFSLAVVFASLILRTLSQVDVTVITADEAVQTLLGPGVQYSNAAFTGINTQLGYMVGLGAPTNFEIASGVVLSCDEAETMEPNYFGDFLTPNISGDQDLLDVANSVPPLIGQNFMVSSVNNIAALEFDFVATGDYLSFNYIFGSDEYLIFVNSSFNDVFAFFLSGPGITGPYASPPGFPDGAINIAYVPGTDPTLPISISSVNNVLNEEYYIDNPGQLDLALNGYTSVFTAESGLQCGETYHIKLAIADGSDQSLKSIVCLQEGSFNIATSLIEPLVLNPAPGFPAFSVLEGCIDAQFIISPPACLTEDLVLDIEITGSGTFGTDYDFSGATQVIVTPDEGDTLDVQTFSDNLVEGTETITISFQYTNVFGEIDTASATLNIIDYQETGIQAIEPVFVCPGTNPTATAVPTNGYAPYAYAWTSGSANSTEVFSPGDAGSYTVTVTDFCGNSATSTFDVIEPEPFSFIDSVELCVEVPSVDLVFGGASPYEVDFDALGLELIGDVSFRGLVAGIYDVTVTDQCNQEANIDVYVEVCDTKIPNVFSPNGDGKNDTFFIEGVDAFPGSELIIYSRWGGVIYQSSAYNNTWRAEDAADGVYFYVFKRSDGENYEGYFHVLR